MKGKKAKVGLIIVILIVAVAVLLAGAELLWGTGTRLLRSATMGENDLESDFFFRL